MSSFFGNKPEQQKQEPKPQHRPFLEVIVIGLFEFSLQLAILILEKFLELVVKPVLSLFFRAIDSREKSNREKGVLAIVCVVSLLFVYKIPYVRNMTLSKGHTLNLGDSSLTQPFPDTKYFERTPDTEDVYIDGRGSVIYRTYGKKVEGLYLPARSGDCHLVPRGKTLTIGSQSPPVYAVGFDKEVAYMVNVTAAELTGWRKFSWYTAHPSYIFGNRDDMWSIKFVLDRTIPWENLSSEWWHAWSFDDGNNPLEMKALYSENAIICF